MAAVRALGWGCAALGAGSAAWAGEPPAVPTMGTIALIGLCGLIALLGAGMVLHSSRNSDRDDSNE